MTSVQDDLWSLGTLGDLPCSCQRMVQPSDEDYRQDPNVSDGYRNRQKKKKLVTTQNLERLDALLRQVPCTDVHNSLRKQESERKAALRGVCGILTIRVKRKLALAAATNTGFNPRTLPYSCPVLLRCLRLCVRSYHYVAVTMTFSFVLIIV